MMPPICLQFVIVVFPDHKYSLTSFECDVWITNIIRNLIKLKQCKMFTTVLLKRAKTIWRFCPFVCNGIKEFIVYAQVRFHNDVYSSLLVEREIKQLHL